MAVILDVAMFSEPSLLNAPQVFIKHRGTWEHFALMALVAEVHVMKFCGFHQDELRDGVRYYFRKANGPLARLNEVCRLLRDISPDCIITHSFRFPVQTRFLKYLQAPGQIMLLQHHSDRVHHSSLVRLLQRLAFSKVDAFTFMSAAMANPFRDAQIIGHQPVFEIMEGSTDFSSQPRTRLRGNTPVFLWVGRLIERKDPFTVLKAFGELQREGTATKLVFVCREGPAKAAFMEMIREQGLSGNVELVWDVPYAQLKQYYDAADYLICSSQDESSAWAVSEGMACGCVPLLSKHPSRESMVNQAGLYFEFGDPRALAELIRNLSSDHFAVQSMTARQRFEEQLSFKAIARDFLNAMNLTGKGPG